MSVANLIRRVGIMLSMIKFGHSVFALPFALTALLLASPGGRPDARVLVWVVVAMVAARSAAMAFNRLVDRRFDAANPRTQDRALPRGEVSVRFTWVFVLVSLLVFHAAAYAINPLCFWLSPLVTVVLLGYSLTKRFTSLSHLVLGLALGLAPCGAWLAARGVLDRSIVTALLLGVAVLFWVAGFDIIYACQDIDFDRRQGLFSLPARLGVRAALLISITCHVLTMLALFVLWSVAGLGVPALVGLVVIGVLLAYEHSIVRPHDLSRVNVAFFNVNGLIGLLLLVAVAIDMNW